MKKRRSHFIDLTGKKFGKITVLGIAPSRADRFVRWHGRCDCGTEKTYYGCNLRNGTTKTCGCVKRSTWTPEAEEKLIEMRKAGVVRKACAREFDTTMSALIGKLYRLRLQGRI